MELLDDAGVDVVIEGDGTLQRAVWLTQEIGVAMPPIPGLLAERLEEEALGLFATDPALLDLDSQGSIAAALAAGGWPASGLAFGYVDRGLSGHWFYTLVGARLMLHVSLRLVARPEQSDLAGTGGAAFAHEAIERFLSHEANYAAATSTMSHPEDAARRIVSYSDAEGLPEEMQALWSPSAGMTPFAPQSAVFVETAELPPALERVIWV